MEICNDESSLTYLQDVRTIILSGEAPRDCKRLFGSGDLFNCSWKTGGDVRRWCEDGGVPEIVDGILVENYARGRSWLPAPMG
jgi:hypothetical protein